MGRGLTIVGLAALIIAAGYFFLSSRPRPLPDPASEQREPKPARRPSPRHRETPTPAPHAAPPETPPPRRSPEPVPAPDPGILPLEPARPSARPEAPSDLEPPPAQEPGPRLAPASPPPTPARAPRPYAWPPPPPLAPDEATSPPPVGDDDPAAPMVWSLDDEGLRGAFQEGAAAIGECYAAWLEAQPEIAGRVTVEFTVVPSDDPDADYGVIQELELTDSQLDHAPLSYCILNVFEEFRFANPEGEPVKVRFPLVFSDEQR